jgi:hypothetical protein
MPANQQIWLELSYLGSVSSVLGSEASSGIANVLTAGTLLTADSTSIWNSGATARANTHGYNIGDVISVSSNSRIFFCTVNGTSSGSLPGGYATAVDGGTVTDGGATFRAGWRFSVAIALSAPAPQLAGYIRALFKANANQAFWFDPVLNLS